MTLNIVLIAILLGGFLGGQVIHRLGAPSLMGMIGIGILLGPQVGNLITEPMLTDLDGLRTIAVMVILMKAGLGLDRDKLRQQGSVAIRLGMFPGLCEMAIVAVVSMYFFQFDWLTGLLLGCILGAESPAVIVPGMLQLKSLGWGVKKGIPDAILTGSALSDALLLLVFSLLLTVLTQNQGSELSWLAIAWIPVQAALQILLGTMVGWLCAKLVVFALTQQKLTQTALQDCLVVATMALATILVSDIFPYYSGYLGVMALGYFLAQLDAPLARQLRNSFDQLWAIAQIVLFVLLGANIQLTLLEQIWLPGLALLAIGVLVGRSIGWWLSTLGSNWSLKEKLFLLPGNSAKATVQAAIGAVPLAMGIEHGDIILAIAALSILVTAPLGAWAIPLTAPKLLQRGEVDPTKVAFTQKTLILAALDASPLAIKVCKKTADLARRTNADVLLLHVIDHSESQGVHFLKQQAAIHLADIPYRWLTPEGTVAETIVHIAQTHQVTAIVMGKQGLGQRLLMGSTSQAVLEMSPIPVTVVAV